MTEMFSEGDVVTVRATVKYESDYDLGVCVDIDGHYKPVFLQPEHLTLVHRHFDIGERVWMGDDHESCGTVLAVNDGFAWIKWENGTFSTEELSHLEHAPSLDEKDEAA